MTRTAVSTRRATHFDSLEQEAFLGLWRTYDRLRTLEDELFSRFDLTAQQYNVLRLLKAQHPRTAPTLDIAQQLVSRAPDITRMLDKLEHRDLIYRERPAADRRTVLIGITESGRALLRKLAPSLRTCHARQLGHLSAAELRRAADLLRAMRLPHESETSHWR